MNYRIVEKDRIKYIEYASAEAPVSSEKDSIELITACFENDCRKVVLHSRALTDDFFRLKTGLAGIILQKFINYRIKVAVILEDDEKVQGRFKELLSESNKGNDFRTFYSTGEAEEWFKKLL